MCVDVCSRVLWTQGRHVVNVCSTIRGPKRNVGVHEVSSHDSISKMRKPYKIDTTSVPFSSRIGMLVLSQ